jgi:hypothetical protein
MKNLDIYPHPGKPSTPPTWEDIERMAMHYPAARHVAVLVERGEMTREQGLIALVYWYAEAFSGLFRSEVERRMNEPSPPRLLPLAETPRPAPETGT